MARFTGGIHALFCWVMRVWGPNSEDVGRPETGPATYYATMLMTSVIIIKIKLSPLQGLLCRRVELAFAISHKGKSN